MSVNIEQFMEEQQTFATKVTLFPQRILSFGYLLNFKFYLLFKKSLIQQIQIKKVKTSLYKT